MANQAPATVMVEEVEWGTANKRIVRSGDRFHYEYGGLASGHTEKVKPRPKQILRQKRTMAARLAKFPFGLDSSPKRTELFISGCKKRKMMTDL